MSELAGTYTIVVNNELEIVSVTHNGKLLISHEVGENLPTLETHRLPDGPIKHGCVGFGTLNQAGGPTDECRLIWGKWW